MKCQVPLIILSLIHIQVCLSQTTVSGDVSGIWSKSQSPYFITGSVRVQASDSLQISAGVEVIFQGNYDIQVDTGATLKAIGTEEEFIIFKAEDPFVGHGGLRFTHSAGSCMLSYCEITNGKGRKEYPFSCGGAIYCDSSNPVIINCRIHNNKTAGSLASGGAIYCSHSAPVIRNNLIFDNYAFGDGADGGAICCRDSSNPIIKDNSIFSNFAEGGGGGISCETSSPEISFNIFENDTSLEHGGAIYCKNASPIIKGNNIFSNWVHGAGGGIFCDSLSKPLIEENVITGNVSKDLAGGGILCGQHSNAIIRGNTISGNIGDDGGGICLYTNSSAIIENNLIAGNQGLWVGGGICCDFLSNAEIKNNIIMNNWAKYRGGGIFCGDVQPVIANCAIVSNTADSLGGGLYIDNTSFPVIFNSIIWENTALIEGNEIYLRSLIPHVKLCSTYVDYTLIDPSRCYVKTGTGSILWGEHIYSNDPKFSDTLLHLEPSSPCIDAGTNALFVSYHDSTYNAPTVDFKNQSRPIGAGWDLGVYEYKSITGLGETNENIRIYNSYIFGCYPNPFNDMTNIHYKLPRYCHVTIKIYNLMGQEIITLVQTDQDAGNYHITWDASHVSSGFYFSHFIAQSDNSILSKKRSKLLLLK